MQINQYTAYAIISSTENKNNTDLGKILLLIDNFAKISTIQQAKDFLRKTYQIKDPVSQFPIGANGFLDIKENSKKYSVRISYTNNNEKECVIYNYKK